MVRGGRNRIIQRQAAAARRAATIRRQHATNRRRRIYLAPRLQSVAGSLEPKDQEAMAGVALEVVERIDTTKTLEEQLADIEGLLHDEFDAIVHPIVESVKEAVTEADISSNMQAWLMEQGPDAVHAFVAAGEQGRDSMVESFRIQRDAAGKLGTAVDNAATGMRGKFNETANSADGVARSIDGINNRLKQLGAFDGMTITVNSGGGSTGPLPPGGRAPHENQLAAAGFHGVVSRPTQFLVAEGGEPELVSVTPATRSSTSRMAPMLDWSQHRTRPIRSSLHSGTTCLSRSLDGI